MEIWEIFVPILLLQGHIIRADNAPINLLCPTYCQCVLFQNNNLANCSAKNLINPSLDLPQSVQILDLSYNEISTVDNSCFMNYSYLRILNVSHNALSTIYPDAFNMLLRVRSIDLSFNRLEDLDEHLFETNHHLIDLNLEGNKFMLQSKRRLLKSSSLRQLSLRNSQIYFIDEMMFIGLPRLEKLDLSQNLLVTINMAAFLNLPNLSFLDLTGNRWMCHDPNMLQELERLRELDTDITLRYCELISPESDDDNDFETINNTFIMAQQTHSNIINFDLNDSISKNHSTQWYDLDTIKQQLEKENEIKISSEMEIDDVDLYDEYSDYTAMPQNCRKACEPEFIKLREACGYKLIKVHDLINRKFTKQENECKRNREYSEEFDLILGLSFAFGCVIGIVLALSVYGCATCINKQCSFKSRSSRYQNVVPDLQSSQPHTLVQVQGDRSRSVARRQIRVRVNNSSPLSDKQPNFVARLFGKPAQYNRVPINHNNSMLEPERNFYSETPPPIYQSCTNIRL